MGCEDGEEDRLRWSRQGCSTIASTRCAPRSVEVGDDRLTVMAALTIADELAEMMKRIAAFWNKRSPTLKDARVTSAEHSHSTNAVVATALNAPPRSASRTSPTSSTRPSNGSGGWRSADVADDYISERGAAGRVGTHSPGPYDLDGSCPGLAPGLRSYGAHLLGVGFRDQTLRRPSRLRAARFASLVWRTFRSRVFGLPVDPLAVCLACGREFADRLEGAALDRQSSRPIPSTSLAPRSPCAAETRAQPPLAAETPFPGRDHARHDRVGLFAAEERDQSGAADAQARGRRCATGVAGRRRTRATADHARLGVRRGARQPAYGASASRCPKRRRCFPTFCMVPLAAFDRNGHRIGYGAGYYDMTIARLRAQ